MYKYFIMHIHILTTDIIHLFLIFFSNIRAWKPQNPINFRSLSWQDSFLLQIQPLRKPPWGLYHWEDPPTSTDSLDLLWHFAQMTSGKEEKKQSSRGEQAGSKVGNMDNIVCGPASESLKIGGVCVCVSLTCAMWGSWWPFSSSVCTWFTESVIRGVRSYVCLLE